MIAAGIDVGGTKIEVQLFDDTWDLVARQRCETPKDYDDFVAAIVDQVAWANAQAGKSLAIGVGAAGLIDPKTGLALTANLPATGRRLPEDIETKAGQPVTFVNDCRALALSEAVFGAGRGYGTVMSLIIGTGVGGGLAIDQHILKGSTSTGGEFGHMAAPAHIVQARNLPIWPCGCGREGCIETYIAGPGLARLAKHMTGQDVTPPQIAERRQGDMADVWAVWCALAAELIHATTVTADPDVVVFGGGLSRIEGITDDLMAAASRAQIGEFGTPPIVLAQGGEASGARGAAYAAWQEAHDG